MGRLTRAPGPREDPAEAVEEVTRGIARYACDLRSADLPAEAVEAAKTAVLDTLGVALAGSRHPVASVIASYAGAGPAGGAGARGGATVIGLDRPAHPETAAFVNGSFAHVLDYDDRGHSTAHTLPAVLAVAEERDASGATLLLGYLAGREVRMHLNPHMDSGRFDVHARGPGSRGWHSTGILGALGSAVGAAKVLDLDPDRTCTALGLAASLASGLVANFGTATKCLHAGNAARNGVVSASLAERGLTADPAILSSRHGLADALWPEGGSGIEEVPAELRGRFDIVDRGVRIKPYPSCTASQGYIEAVRALRERHGLAARDVASVTCTASPSLNRPRPRDGLEAKFSAPFAIVATLIDGAVTLDNCTDGFLARDDVQALLDRTEQVGQEAEGWIRVRTHGGQEHTQVLLPPRNLVTPSEVAAKFHACADPVVGERAAAALEAAVGELEDLPSVRELTRHLAVPGRGGAGPAS